MAAAMKSMHHCANRMRIGADEMMCEAAAKMFVGAAAVTLAEPEVAVAEVASLT